MSLGGVSPLPPSVSGSSLFPTDISSSYYTLLECLEGCLEAWSWLGTPTLAILMALALNSAFSLYPLVGQHVPCRPKGADDHSARGRPKPPAQSHCITVEQHPRGGLLRRLARKFSMGMGRRLHDARSFEIPFMRRRSVGGVASSRASSEGSQRSSSERAAMRNRTERSRSSLRLEDRWQPSMARISSGRNLVDMASRDAHAASSVSRFKNTSFAKNAEDAFVYNGDLAVDCLAHDTTEAAMDAVKKVCRLAFRTSLNVVVLDEHLLQFGMLIGESSAELAIGQQRASHPVQSLGIENEGSSCLFGTIDCPELFARGWERLVEEHKPGLHYWVCRRHLRKGLFMYKSRTVYEQATPQQMVAFTFAGNETRQTWDESSMALLPLAPPRQPGISREALQSMSYAQSSFMYSRTRFPPPMAQREYVFARRIWYKADDGGCYCISRACEHPSPPAPGCRSVRVEDFAAGFVIRAVPGIYHADGAVEVVSNYFEDSRANSGIVNMGIRKALWPVVRLGDSVLRAQAFELRR